MVRGLWSASDWNKPASLSSTEFSQADFAGRLRVAVLRLMLRLCSEGSSEEPGNSFMKKRIFVTSKPNDEECVLLNKC